MSTRIYGSIFAAALAVALVLPLAPTAAGQQKGGKGKAFKKPEGPPGPAPKMANGKPDFSGIYQPPRMADVTQNSPCCEAVPDLPYTEWGKRAWDTYDAEKEDYAGSCLPFGLLRSVGGPHPVQIMQNDKYISFMWEQNSWFHVTPIDGRKHRDLEPTWFGDSVGHWEGDTLVIDTINFNGKTRVDTIGHPVSDQLHTIERYTRPTYGRIDYTITIDDPKTYTKPWTSPRTWILHPEWEIMEYSCEENNKSLWEGRIKPPSQSPNDSK
jgi:hypothetical protein